MVFSSPFPDVQVPDRSLTALLFDDSTVAAHEVVLVDGVTGDRWTFSNVAERVRQQASAWVGAGVAPGDVVALMASNSPDYVMTFHALLAAGAVVTTVNPTYTRQEVAHQLVDAGATRLITTSKFLPVARRATQAIPILVLDRAHGATSVSDLPTSDAPLPEVGGSDLAVLPYSSGTTGLPKGVMLTHRNLVANLLQSRVVLDPRPDDAYVAVLPFFHIYGMQVLMNLGLMVGASIVTLPRFDLETFVGLHQQHSLTRAYVAPPMVLALAHHPVVDDYDLSALTYMLSAAAPLSADLADACSTRLGCEVVQGYGMTELSPVSHATPPGACRSGSVGVALPSTEVQIMDPVERRVLGIDEDGEVWVRGPQVMLGYLGQDAATKATVDDEGWLHTGDIGHVDEDGHLYIVDRLKELIKYKGFQIAPAELETILLAHPDVADAAVVGVPDAEAGERPAAWVVLQPGGTATAEALQGFVAERVAGYKQIRTVTFTEAIPKSPSGKILRRVLRSQASA